MRTRRARWTGGLVLSLMGSGVLATLSVLAAGPAAAQAGGPAAPPAEPVTTRSLSVPPASAPSVSAPSVSAPSGTAPAGAPQLSSAHSTTVTVPSPGSQTRAVVELFTSQGCSSCPEADRVLAELKKDPTLVAVSLPVTYWDYLGWKDTLADPRHTARQTAYSHARGDRAVYTPQVVVNGAAHVLGSDRAAIERAVARGRGKGAGLPVPVRLSVSDGKVSVSADGARPAVASGSPAAAAAAAATSGEVWLLGVTSAVEVAVGRGENSGRTIVYSNVVRRWLKLGDWSGATRTWTVPVADIKGDRIDAVAVLIQGGTAKTPGVIHGAAFQRLH
ncbi:DUF1223 domain-containing protein [Rhodoplanes sp. TEM]|uniref:DUF1223 domain-containing protein n=1 Tax=Rhodoplanes tepidamans TaxID=200616 RepID=A0ABT5J2X5_RHOTP|nr:MULTISPECIES: DUF1223 domain-containing protein [Rhodoplanes]MDC7784064.1 DUF1223 domain-containing protein [Rhodoplanes tepidamans]MDC7986836.1 DUF1223 domain-containing protein [Rhodoplanes sp. TEM]MDQ0356840.1 hypothetical protein [Rhodoplanes tepidamans]